MTKKIAMMYDAYGKDPEHICRQCCNCAYSDYQGERYTGCLRYGAIHKNQIDWNVKSKACGMFNNPFNPRKDKPLDETLESGQLIFQGTEK